MLVQVDKFMVCDDDTDPKASQWETTVHQRTDDHGLDYLIITQEGQHDEPDLIIMDRKDFLRIAELLKGS
jgi:hypothetical protein